MSDKGLAKLNTVPVSLLHELFTYCPESGDITWEKPRSPRAVKGSKAGSLKTGGYLQIRIEGKNILAHRIAWAMHYGEWPNTFIDHINRDKIDNRIANLRLASRSENNRNIAARKGNKLQIKGVSYHARDRKFVAFISLGDKQKYLGGFDTAEEASLAYISAEQKLRGCHV
jgi:hypothetical protein